MNPKKFSIILGKKIQNKTIKNGISCKKRTIPLISYVNLTNYLGFYTFYASAENWKELNLGFAKSISFPLLITFRIERLAYYL